MLTYIYIYAYKYISYDESVVVYINATISIFGCYMCYISIFI